MITVLALYERISLFHTMEPFFAKKFRRLFKFVQNPDYCLRKDQNKILFMERWFMENKPPDLSLMSRLRNKYKTIVFFDGYAAAGTHLLEILPYVDRLFHKSVFTDTENYRRRLYAKRLFADYFYHKLGVKDPSFEHLPELNLSPEDVRRVELSWNIGLGDYPRRHFPQRVGVVLARCLSPDLGRMFRSGHSKPPGDFSAPRRSLGVHARTGLLSNKTVSLQRKICLDKIAGDERFVTGFVSQNRYYKELTEAKIVFSSFGWGEVCFRDFEAITAGALLLKPDMSHLRTWPDVYIPGETYVPVNWDGSNLIEKAEYYLNNHEERMRIARNGWEQYRKELSLMEERFQFLLKDIIES